MVGYVGFSLGMGILVGLRFFMCLFVFFCCLWLLFGVVFVVFFVGEICVVSEIWMCYI